MRIAAGVLGARRGTRIGRVLALAAMGLALAGRNAAAGPAPAAVAPVDVCAPGTPLPINADVDATLSPAREALGRWSDAASRCPGPGVLFRAAAAHAKVAAEERSVIHLQQALEGYRQTLAAGPAESERALVESRVRECDTKLTAWRARPLLQEAREAAARDDGPTAVARYDAYLQAAGSDPDRAAVEAERARFIDRYRDDAGGDDRKRRITGGLILGAGLAAAGGGAALLVMAFGTADRARAADVLELHDSRLRTANYQLAGGAALATVGAIAAVGGIVRLAWSGHPTLHALWVLPAPGGLVAGGRF